jgi:uncharacterized membrane protein YcaP (DUF421 family)
MDLPELLRFHVSPVELVLRGSCVYLFLFLVFRFVVRRDVGVVGLADILVLVIIADASQSAMAGDAKTLAEGVVLISTIVGWNLLFDWLAYHYAWFARFAQPEVLALVRHGRVIRRNLQRELMTLEDLESKIREAGVETLSEVKHAFMESDGKVTVVPARALSSGREPAGAGTGR